MVFEGMITGWGMIEGGRLDLSREKLRQDEERMIVDREAEV